MSVPILSIIYLESWGSSSQEMPSYLHDGHSTEINNASIKKMAPSRMSYGIVVFQTQGPLVAPFQKLEILRSASQITFLNCLLAHHDDRQ